MCPMRSSTTSPESRASATTKASGSRRISRPAPMGVQYRGPGGCRSPMPTDPLPELAAHPAGIQPHGCGRRPDGALRARDRAVLVTGAASGIGQAACERLAAEGARVALVDRDQARLEALAAALTGQGALAVPLLADVSREDAVRGAVARAVAALGNLAGLVTSAGVFRPGDRQRVGDVDLETF